MIDPITTAATNIGQLTGTAAGSPAAQASGAGNASFADTLKASVNDVAQMQQDATQQVNDLATGRTGDLSGVMTAVEKSDLAFKTLLAIRSKLMDAYDELKSMPM